VSMKADHLWPTLWAAVHVAALLVILWLNCGCHDGCKPDDTRCHGTRVELCDQAKDWNMVLDCKILEPYDGEICCWDAELDSFSCTVPEECEE